LKLLNYGREEFVRSTELTSNSLDFNPQITMAEINSNNYYTKAVRKFHQKTEIE
jgi:hypothetical protein